MQKTGWNPKKVAVFKGAFYNFLENCFIDSKEKGRYCLADGVYRAQRRFLDGIFDGLEEDIHDFKVLKSRQLGITTISRALSTFWVGMHDGLRAGMVFDKSENTEEARREITNMINALPPKLRFPKIKGGKGNRYGLALENGSSINFMSAGVRAQRTTGALGASKGFNFAHCCMAPGTPVIVEDGKIIAIENVPVNTRVITHTGAVGTVIANVGQQNTRGPMLRIKAWLNDPVVCTADHKIATARGMVKAGEIKAYDLLIMPIRAITHAVASSKLAETVARAQNGGSISAGSGAQVELNEEFGFAIGYYLAEGCLTFQRRGAEYKNAPSGIIFTRHRSEKEYADRAFEALKPFTTGLRSILDKPNSLTTTEHIYGSSLARWIKEHFGETSNKRIPDEVFSWGVDFCKGLVAGMLCGDGSKTLGKTTNGPPVNRVSLTTTRSSFATQMRDLVASLGYGWGALKHRPAGVYYNRNCAESWTLTWTGEPAKHLRGLMELPLASNSGGGASVQKYKIENGFVYLKIKSIETGVDVPTMYDLSVDHEDHTFRTNAFSVSNSEMCSWENDEGVVSFQQALAEDFENRLYIWESTARGFNVWKDMWDEARKDTENQKAIFIGWWAKDNQIIRESDPAFAKYGVQPPTKDEQQRIDEVKRLYDWEVTREQLAWFRRKSDPTLSKDDTDIEDPNLRQNQPWTEDEAFVMSGSSFFAPEKLTVQAAEATKHKFQGFKYYPGSNFVETDVFPAKSPKDIQLKVWNEPDRDGEYVIAADPAFGHDEKNDRSAIQVVQCFADGLEQVAEFASATMPTHQFAWVIASLVGWYQNVTLIIELNGPGDAVWKEYMGLRQIVQNGFLRKEAEEAGLRDIFNNVRNYIFARSDSMGSGNNYHWKTQSSLKVAIMERLRDMMHNGSLQIKSQDTLEEMRAITREGDCIEAKGRNKDDRAVAMAMAVRCWEDRVRRRLINENKTKHAFNVAKRMNVADMYYLYSKNQLSTFFKRKESTRRVERIQAAQKQWRGR